MQPLPVSNCVPMENLGKQDVLGVKVHLLIDQEILNRQGINQARYLPTAIYGLRNRSSAGQLGRLRRVIYTDVNQGQTPASYDSLTKQETTCWDIERVLSILWGSKQSRC